MGDNQRNSENINTNDQEVRDGNGRSGNNQDTETTKEKAIGDGTRDSRSARRTRKVTTKEEKPVGLVDVKEPIEVEIQVPEKPKRKRPARKKKKEEPEQKNFGASDVSLLLTSISTVVSSRKGCEHWKITDSEAMTIAEPLTNILMKSNLFGQIAQHSDAIALATACGMVFTPRIVMQAQINKVNKEAKKNAKKFGTSTARNEKATSFGNNGAINKTSSNTNTNGGNAIEEFYGFNQIC